MPRSYVRLLFASGALFVLLAAAIDFAVDPYGMYRWLDVAGFNQRKPTAQFHSRMAKPYHVLHVRPRTLLLGNSRVEVGLDPNSGVWPAELRPVYNMALPATGIDTSLRVLRHVQHAGKLSLVVLGIDFFDFVSDESAASAHPDYAPQPGEFEKRLLTRDDGSANPARTLQAIGDHGTTLFSLNTLADSLHTVAAQHRADQADVTALGFNPMLEYRRFVRADGHHALFQQVDATYIGNYLRLKPAIYARGTVTSFELEQLRRLIRFCRESGIRLILFVHPSHAHMLESYRLAGMWPLFEEWKRAVVRIVAESAGPQETAPAVELWDFSGYGEHASEAVPGPEDKRRPMRWYWEAGHYKRELGDLVLARVLGTSGPTAAPDFGVRITRQNIDGQLAAIRADRDRYSLTRAEEIAALEKMAGRVKGRMAARSRPR